MTKENKFILYHYTTMNTFYNMMEHSLCREGEGDNKHPTYITMWATHYAYQNDPTEGELFFKGLELGILNYTEKNNITLTDKSKTLILQSKLRMKLFTISFSEKEDDLTMWRGYGQNGDGISLGFDFSKLPLALPMYGINCKERKSINESDPEFLLRRDIRKCEYIDTSNIKIAEEACERTIVNILDKDESWSDVKQAIIANEYASIYKHYKYEAEGEWRIIKSKIIPKYRIGENRTLIPYIEVNVPIECLKKIIIGPCQTAKKMTLNVKSFLLSKGVDTTNIEIIPSMVPYRNRL